VLGAIARRDVGGARRIITSHIQVMKEDLIEVFHLSGRVIEEKEKQMGL
jgi:hypothetical protein